MYPARVLLYTTTRVRRILYRAHTRVATCALRVLSSIICFYHVIYRGNGSCLCCSRVHLFVYILPVASTMVDSLHASLVAPYWPND